MKISVCMMVKNEEKNLERCLDSLKKLKLMDELCIFDTGSTDKTKTIARKYKAKMIRVKNLDDYYVETKFGKKINFSKARNKSMEKATGDWLLLMDADEELVFEKDDSQDVIEDVKKFLTYLDKKFDGVAVKFRDMQKGKTHVRFPPPRFFRRGSVHYDGIVHNSPRFNDPAAFYPHLTVLHYGFDLTAKQKKEKDDRTLGLLMKRLEDDPSDFRVYFYLSQMYGEKSDFDKCIEFCIKYIRNAQYIKRFNTSIYFTLIQACMYGDKPLLADKWLGEAIKELPDDVDIAMAIIDYGVWQRKPVIVLEGAARFVRSYDKMAVDPLSAGSRFVYNFNQESLCKALFHLSAMRLQDGVFQFERLQKEMKGIPGDIQQRLRKDIKRAIGETGIERIKIQASAQTTKKQPQRRKTTKKGE